VRVSNSIRCAFGIAASAVIFAGCNAPSPSALGPATSPLQVIGAASRGVHPDRGRSWMLPDAKSSDLLYVSDASTYDVYAFSLPKGKLVGTLTNQNNPAGLCVDKKGDVYVTQLYGGGNIVEYKHGGTTPIKTLSDPSYEPGACSVDPATGTLAVANIVSDSFGQGTLMIFRNASGSGTLYSPPSTGSWFSVNTVGYDNKSNVFFAGNCNSAFCAGELPSGSSTTENVTLSTSPANCGTVQWDGKYITFDDQSDGTVYRYTFSGTNGTEVGDTVLNGSSDVDGSWISGKMVAAPQQNGADVLLYKYPAGGAATRTITGLTEPFGSTISVAKKKKK
jgi:hypothetical protein